MSTRSATAVDARAPILPTQQSKEAVSSATPPVKIDRQRTVETNGQQRKDIILQLQYLKDDPLYNTTKPTQVTPNFLDRDGRTNVQLTPGPPEILNDVRGREYQYTLDNNGFQYVHAPTKFTDWSSQPQIAKEYLPEMEELLKREIDGCDEIIFYDVRIRQAGDQGARVQRLSFNPFARQVHVDNTETSVIEKIRNVTEMKAECLLNGRARIINIWRPIKHPVYDCGLCVADGGKLQNGDVIGYDRYRPDTGEYWDTMGIIQYRQGFEWYYKSLQEETDVLLFKNYDSATDVHTRYCLHTAFDLPSEDVPANAPTRESIEVRALIFTHPKGVLRPSAGAAQQPLALSLEQGHLKLVDDEHSITDRIRTDIDGGPGVKEAMLILFWKESNRLERVRAALVTERDQLQQDLTRSLAELEQAQEQLSIQIAYNAALESKITSIEQRLQQSHGDLHKQIDALSRVLVDASLFEHTRARSELDGLRYAAHAAGASYNHIQETALLLERIHGQQIEIQKWKAEAMGRGNEAVSRSWQASVDEAVRKEREKDSLVIKQLMEVIERLEAGRE